MKNNLKTMKNIFSIFGICVFCVCFGQEKYTIEQAENTKDVRVIASFIKENPKHPKVSSLKIKMANLMGGNKVEPTAQKPQKSSKKPTSTKNDQKKTADLLTHMFSNDPNKKEAYIAITNKANCDIEVSIIGKKSHNLKVSAKSKNFILLDKGKYTLTSSICGAKYESTKNITKDMELFLGN